MSDSPGGYSMNFGCEVVRKCKILDQLKTLHNPLQDNIEFAFSFDYDEFMDEPSYLCDKSLDNCDVDLEEPQETETNLKVVDFVLNNTKVGSDGRLLMPLTWNDKCAHLLSQNYNLSRNILKSTLKKLIKDPFKLKLYDDVIREQTDLGIIEKIPNLEDFLKSHPEASFLAHMGIFRLDHDSTKCRVVFLSNLAERNSYRNISHNQAIHPGPIMNSKISTAVILHRLDRNLLIFDIKKLF